ncbi:MAG: sugar phosphate isomerase/epimerase [Candidatus Omnitrophica bacterium]|nr:sugar phosphate isomerase/epimerase [Candidatus Omnitrophota bacterium]
MKYGQGRFNPAKILSLPCFDRPLISEKASVLMTTYKVIGRRQFLKSSIVLTAGIGFGKVLPAIGAQVTPVKLSTPAMEKLGWKLSVQLYTYRRFPLFEALDKVAALGIRHIEPLSALKVDSHRPDVRANEDMPADVRKEFKEKLAERGMFLSSIFANFNGTPGQAKRLFEFCKEMGTGTIVAEPPAEALDMIEKLCLEYQINVAFHNHARGQSPYWKPEQVLAACQNRTERMGACADAGQWARSGLDPVESLRKLKGRIISFHLKDIAKKNDPNCRNTVFGEGEGDFANVLQELKRLGYRGLTTIDFEHDTPALQEDMARNVAYMEERAKELLNA